MPKFGTKNALLGCFWAIVIFEIRTLQFVKNEFLTHTVNFGTWSAFCKVPGFAFSQDPVPGPVLSPSPLYNVCPNQSIKQVTNI